MTGFGRASRQTGSQKITIEIKSLNSKGLDLRLKVPPVYQARELEFRRILAEQVIHGKLDLSLQIENEQQAEYRLDLPLIEHYLDQLEALAQKRNLPTDELLHTVSRLPGVVIQDNGEISDEAWQQVSEVLNLALQEFLKFRQTEGKAIFSDIQQRIEEISTLLLEIEPHEAERLERIRQRIQQQLEATEWKSKIDSNRLEQEMIYYLEKFDISEEKSRLTQHCSYFVQELENPKIQKGSKLNFIAQEIGREINTIGSKANSAPIQRLVVRMKDELEKIKEQVANVL